MAVIDPNGPSVLFRPITLLAQENLTLYRCLPAIKKSDESIKSGKSLLLHTKGTKETAKKNARLLNMALSELSHAHENGKDIRMVIPVNTHSLVGKDEASSIVSQFRRIDADIRKSIIVELFDFPRVLTLEILEDSLIPLFPFVDTFIAQPELGMDDYTVFANCNFFGVTIDFDDAPAGPDQLDRLMKFWARATKRRLKIFVQGIGADEVVTAAKRYEAMGMDGPIIGGDVDTLSDEPAP